ncbi:MAG: threonine/serine ThrE exporter family protein [Nocardioidaceae bacterium]
MAEDLREVYQAFDLALRIGEVVLSSGAAASDAAASMIAVTSAAGVREADVSVTFTELSISWQPSPYSPPETHLRNVRFRGLDYSKLTAVDHLVREIVAGRVGLDDARKILDTTISSGRPYPRWASTLGWGTMAAGIGLLIGGDWLVMVAAFLSAVVIDYVNRQLSLRRIPAFYQQVLGGFLATMGALVLHTLAQDSNVSEVVAAGIIVLLAGIAFVGAVQDAVTGYYITATARSFEALLLTGGIIGGVTAGLAVADRYGITFAVEPYQARGIGYLPIAMLGAAVAAAGFVFACYAPKRAILAAVAMGALGQVGYRLMIEAGLGIAWGTGLAAVMIGVVAFSVAGRVKIPPLVVVVSGMTPLLPGGSIYRGLYQMSEGDVLGLTSLVSAAVIAVALAAGVIFGEYVAQPLKREARRLETKLSGPRLVGPLRVRRTRRGDRERRSREDRRTGRAETARGLIGRNLVRSSDDARG